MNYPKLGARVTQYRLKMELSRPQAASQAGISFGTLIDVENDIEGTLTIEAFEKLCRWMRADPRDFLLGWP